jgi:glucose-1-phosphate thymidylyltransferase
LKAVIPVAGAGTKLRPLTYTQPKPLIPVAGKPIIAFIIDRLLQEGVDDFVFIIGYLGEKIRDYVQENYPSLKMKFVRQEKREGLGHAIHSAKDVLENAEEIIIILGDTIFEADLASILTCNHSCLGIKKVKDPRNFGVVELDEEGTITHAVEKPKIPKSNLAMVGIYKIKEVKDLLNALEYNIEHGIETHGEYHLTDGLVTLIHEGVIFKTEEVTNWYDCGKKEILLETNAKLLDKSEFNSKKLPNFKNTIIIQPVSIGQGCTIKNSIIGPHVTIGNNASLNYTIIRSSIIGDFATIEQVVLEKSIVGSDAAIKGMSQSLNIGDNTEIDFS